MNTFNPAGADSTKRFDPDGDGPNCAYVSPRELYGYFGHTVYYCDYQNARFFVLNNDFVCEDPTQAYCRTLKVDDPAHRYLEHQLGNKQLKWLEKNLVDNGKALNFFIQHEPAYGTCAHSGDTPN